jgi:hypothetical protein
MKPENALKRVGKPTLSYPYYPVSTPSRTAHGYLLGEGQGREQ